MENKKEFALSPSRIMSYLKCSYVYYMENVIKMDDGGNPGSMRGSVLHDIAETLIRPKYKQRVQKIIDSGSVLNDPVIVRYIKMQMHKQGLHEEFDHKDNNNFDLICEMLYTVLSHDFYCEGWEIDYANLETKFTLKSEDPEYVIRGLIDKPAKKDGYYKISDYKSSQSKKTEEELELEIQALSYILYCIKELGAKDASAEFIFARFPDDPVDVVENITEEQLKGFEEYLSTLYKYLKDFTTEKAYSNFAADMGYTKCGGFKGLVCCGYAKHEGHCYSDTHKDASKRGKPYYHCPYKFGFKYYSLRDEDGNIVKSSKNEEDLEIGENQYVTEHDYAGCPRFNN